MTQIAAIVLLLNGVQISMPAPAMLIEGHAWVPLRAVAEHLGYRVYKPGDGPPRVVRGKTDVEVPESRLLKGVTYVPALWLEKLGVGVAYDGPTKRLSLTAVALGPEATEPAGGAQAGASAAGAAGRAAKAPTIGDIVADPAAWADRSVTLRGECLGYRANKLWPALRFGPPKTRSDWVLRGDGGALYCTGGLRGDITGYVGQRMDVTGTLRITKDAWPYLEVASVTAVPGLAGLCCYISTDSVRYGVQGHVKMSLLVRNDSDKPIELTFGSGKTFDFFLKDAGGKRLWRWSDGKMFTMAIVKRPLAPGASYKVQETLDLGGVKGLVPGVYYVSAELPGITRSYQQPLEVGKPR